MNEDELAGGKDKEVQLFKDSKRLKKLKGFLKASGQHSFFYSKVINIRGP